MESRPYQFKMYIDKFNRTYPQNLLSTQIIKQTDVASSGRAALPSDVIIYKNNQFFCNNRKLDIAVNDKDHPFVGVNHNYKSGLQEYDGKPFKAYRWVFDHKGWLIPYENEHVFTCKEGYIKLSDTTVSKVWEPFVE